jgi:hypothetical protein
MNGIFTPVAAAEQPSSSRISFEPVGQKLRLTSPKMNRTCKTVAQVDAREA